MTGRLSATCIQNFYVIGYQGGAALGSRTLLIGALEQRGGIPLTAAGGPDRGGHGTRG